MKRINKFLFIFSLIFSVGCGNDFLDLVPGDRVTTGLFYSTPSEIKAATAALYGGNHGFSYNDKFAWCAGDAMAGDLYHDWDQEGQFFFLTFTEGNSYLAEGWRGLYNVIAFANSLIADMPAIARGHGVSNDVINAGVGEARFIRAYAYYLLAEYWEEVPIVENNAQVIASGNLKVPKYTQKSVYEFIRRDLEFAAANLPASDAAGRVTKWAAKGLLAKVYLTMASHLGDGNSAQNFALAKQHAGEVITESGLTLLPNYADLFKIENDNNVESLFALQWVEGAWGLGNSRQAVLARNTTVTGGLEAWGGNKSVTYDFIETLLDNAQGKVDKRRPAIYMQDGDYYPELNKKDGGYTYYVVNVASDGSVLETKAALLNNIKKGVVGSFEDTGGKATANQATALNQYMLRLADVYLIYAEATLGSSTSTTDAKALEYFNTVRARAGLDPRGSLTFRDILNERRIEFALESISWLDIKRYSYRNQAEALDYLNNQNRARTYELIEGGDQTKVEDYELVNPSQPVVITANRFRLPIPSRDLTDNELLKPSEEAQTYSFND
jgi:hypothetical protein